MKNSLVLLISKADGAANKKKKTFLTIFPFQNAKWILYPLYLCCSPFLGWGDNHIKVSVFPEW